LPWVRLSKFVSIEKAKEEASSEDNKQNYEGHYSGPEIPLNSCLYVYNRQEIYNGSW